jgi:xanthine/uracil/vitamin C permease (AzgA family)
VGLFIGVVFGLLGLVAVSRTVLVKTLLRAVRIAFGTTIAAGIAGYFYGRLVLAKTGVTWYLPDNLQHPADFITVGSIHNFGYCGGILGLLGGVVYMLRHRGKSALNSPVPASF